MRRAIYTCVDAIYERIFLLLALHIVKQGLIGLVYTSPPVLLGQLLGLKEGARVFRPLPSPEG